MALIERMVEKRREEEKRSGGEGREETNTAGQRQRVFPDVGYFL